MTTDELIYKSIENNYFVDFINGVVCSKRTNKEIYSYEGNSGYKMVRLGFNNKWKTCFVHRAVFIAKNGIKAAFGKEVSHKDQNKLNNSLTNLQALTSTEHKIFDGFVGKKNWESCVSCGDADGRISGHRKTPDRINGVNYGFNGFICRDCYCSIQQERRQQFEFLEEVRFKKILSEEGFCEKCNTKLTAEDSGSFHHILPIRDGGDGSYDNCMLVHNKCHTKFYKELHRKVA